MNGVSCRVLRVIIDGVDPDVVSTDALFHDLGISLEYLSKTSNQISWDVFATIVNRMSDQLGGPEAMRKFGEENIMADTLRIFQYVGRALSHPRDIYLMGARWMGPSLFPMTTATMSERADGVLIQRLTIQEGHSDCPAFFYAMQGCLAAAPVGLGHGYSDVSIDLEPRRATYTIRPRTTSSGTLGKIIRAIRARVAFPSMLRELESQQAAIEESYHDLRHANKQISAQAFDLAQVNAIGQRLSEQIDLPRLVDLLVRIMLEELRLPGVELRLSATPAVAEGMAPGKEAEPRLLRNAGRTAGPATRCHVLEAGGRALGTLRVWDAQERGVQSSEALLQRMLPWISIALDNARTYEALERHAAVLEQRVNERTARLLAANHHLVREIEERQRATEALVESEAQLRASERLASVGTLAAGIAHEINNPIGSILAAAQLAQLVRDDANSEAQVAEALDTIVSQTRRCGEIVRSVLQFSRDEPTQKWDREINEVVRRSIKLTDAFAEENGARLSVDLPDVSAWAHVNPIQIEQAVVNLIRNAIEAGARSIGISVREERHAGLVLIEIRDDGAGVSEVDRLRIFEPFYTTKQSAGGTGLGLSVVHGIATEHGGALKIDSSDQAGTTVLLELPTCPAPPNALREKPDDTTRA